MTGPAPLPRHAATPIDAVTAVELEAFLREVMLAAGPLTLEHFRTPLDVDNKRGDGGYDPVTAADRGAETLIRERIAARYPEHGIYGEEHGHETGSAGLTWVIDPIDGTRAFITGQIHWGILLGLHDGEGAVLGGMHQPFTGELFCGGPGGAWWERGGERRALSTRTCERIEDAVLCTTTPDMFTTDAERSAYGRVESAVRLRRYGGDCYSYCMLAHGLTDLIIEADLAPYDVQGLIPLVEAAGGVITDWEGGSPAWGGRIVAAGDRRVHTAALELIGSG